MARLAFVILAPIAVLAELTGCRVLLGAEDLGLAGDAATPDVGAGGAIDAAPEDVRAVDGDARALDGASDQPTALRVEHVYATSYGDAPGSLCVVLSNGHAHCRGQNDARQLASGASASRFGLVTVDGTTPLVVSTSPRAIAFNNLQSSFTSTCFVESPSGRVLCAGSGDVGQLGRDAGQRASLGPVVFANQQPIDGVTGIVGTYQEYCALRAGSLLCWGSNYKGEVNPATQGDVDHASTTGFDELSNVDAVALSQYFACALVGGAVKCWGYCQFSMCGPGTDTNVLTKPTALPGLESGVTWVGGTDYRLCALRRGTLYCTGASSMGSAGVNPYADGVTSVPLARVSLITNDAIGAVAVGEPGGCAVVDADGHVQCWSANARERNGQTVLTDREELLRDVVELAVGATFACALTRAHDVYCWGEGAPSAVPGQDPTRASKLALPE